MDFWKTLLFRDIMQWHFKDSFLKASLFGPPWHTCGFFRQEIFQGISKFELKAMKAGWKMREGCACVLQRVKWTFDRSSIVIITRPTNGTSDSHHHTFICAVACKTVWIFFVKSFTSDGKAVLCKRKKSNAQQWNDNATFWRHYSIRHNTTNSITSQLRRYLGI